MERTHNHLGITAVHSAGIATAQLGNGLVRQYLIKPIDLIHLIVLQLTFFLTRMGNQQRVTGIL